MPLMPQRPQPSPAYAGAPMGSPYGMPSSAPFFAGMGSNFSGNQMQTMAAPQQPMARAYNQVLPQMLGQPAARPNVAPTNAMSLAEILRSLSQQPPSPGLLNMVGQPGLGVNQPQAAPAALPNTLNSFGQQAAPSGMGGGLASLMGQNNPFA